MNPVLSHNRDDFDGVAVGREIARAAREREIEEVVHFTRVPGAVGILHTSAIKSRSGVPKDKRLEFVGELNTANAQRHRDAGWHDFVNLSISRVNPSFYEYSTRIHPEASWVVFAFDYEILGHPGVVYCTTNNTYPSCRRAEGLAGFEAMFADVVEGKWQKPVVRPAECPSSLTTDRQAEVLYPSSLKLDFLRRIVVGDDKTMADIQGVLGGLGREFTVDFEPAVFK